MQADAYPYRAIYVLYARELPVQLGALFSAVEGMQQAPACSQETCGRVYTYVYSLALI